MINYVHKTHKRSRSLKIKIEPNGEVVVVTPPRFRISEIEKFIKQQETWIMTHVSKMKAKQSSSQSETTVNIFGKKYEIVATANHSQKIGVAIQGQKLIINLPHLEQAKQSEQKKHQKTHLERFLKNTAEKYIIPRTHQIGKKMDQSFKKITLRQQKTRWGSCSSKGNLNFNWRLIHAPTKVIDYVIIHELSHRQHMDHSLQFWSLVAKFDPAYRQHRGWLKRQGMAVG